MIVVALLLSYVVGSIPTGLWLGLKLHGVDIRQRGSKNIGATNTLRVLGTRLGIAALAADAGKGAVSVLLISRLSAWEYAPLACGLAAIVGHTLSVFLRFKGGKGVATSAGTFLALLPVPMSIALATFIVTVALSRMVSLGSMLGAAVMTAAVWILPHDVVYRVIVTAVALLIIYRHRTNIQRIVAGTESRLGAPSKD